MLNTVQHPLDKKIITNSVATAVVAGTMFFTMNAPVFYPQEQNTVQYIRQKNSSLDFLSSDVLSRYFSISTAAAIFLQHADFMDILIQAEQHIRKYFTDEKLLLTVDEAEPGRVLLYIQTHLSAETASERLDALDDSWIIDHVDELKNIIIDVMFI